MAHRCLVSGSRVHRFGTVQKAFRFIDEDASGTITRDELDRYLEVIHLNCRPELVTALFEMIDQDASGSFDFKEFARVISSGDVLKLEAVQDRFDGYEAKRLEEEAAARAILEAKAARSGMTVEEYEAYWKDVPSGSFAQQTSAQMAELPRDRWGKIIRGPVQAHAI